MANEDPESRMAAGAADVADVAVTDDRDGPEGEEAEVREGPGSFVASDNGIPLMTERTHATAGNTYEGVRDNEQLGRTRNAMLRDVQMIAPPAADGAQIQNDQLGRPPRQAVEAHPSDSEEPGPDASNTDGTDDISLGKLPGGNESLWK